MWMVIFVWSLLQVFWPVLVVGMMVLGSLMLMMYIRISNKNEKIQRLQREIDERRWAFWLYEKVVERLQQDSRLCTVSEVKTNHTGWNYQSVCSASKSGATLWADLYMHGDGSNFVRIRAVLNKSLLPDHLTQFSLQNQLALKVEARHGGMECRYDFKYEGPDKRLDEILGDLQFYESEWEKIQPQIQDAEQRILEIDNERQLSLDKAAEALKSIASQA